MKSKIDVESSQCMFKQNLKRCLVQQIICLHYSTIGTIYLPMFITFNNEIYKCVLFLDCSSLSIFLMQIDQSTCFVTPAAPLLHLCTINEMQSSETESGMHKPIRFQSPLSHSCIMDCVILVINENMSIKHLGSYWLCMYWNRDLKDLYVYWWICILTFCLCWLRT